MIKGQIEFAYKDTKVDEFDVDYSAGEFYIETLDMKITLDKYQFENLREKMNELYEALR
ncbi:hypothetical protein [Clostridium tetani]|uniref:hypothetical protein n=1 Tax=Clostridium phage phiCT19406C TaxID=1567011 RepID=UPI000572A8CC|nr:hypothetical protein [Clostridium tetani]YP_009218041.1 hypothetical protein phiCT19406C_12 [Clostridium phage phiCT19406C]AJA42835.1 hypothetical protein phiCT19406C_12 [Clostridium phage phiCT19406C]SJZ95573.1 hypothetical protein SAMN02745112_01870 [Clostridium tetani]